MQKLNPGKLNVEYGDSITKASPIIPRRYTLTHSDTTGELFLYIGKDYAYDKIGPMRDEVIGEWRFINNNYIFFAQVHVDGNKGISSSVFRNKIFVKELPLALEAIRYGDREFFTVHSALDYAPIFIDFDSIYVSLNRIEYWGTPSYFK